MYLSNPDLRGISDGDIEYEDWQIKELAKCKRDPLHFILTYIKVVDGDKGLIPFQPREYSIEFIKNIHSNNYTLVKFPRQSGKSITVAAYLVWYIIFNKKKNAVILAHQKSMATEQLSRIKAMIQEIPLWMQQPVLKWNESSIAFANDSKIVSSATQQKSVRGFTVNFLYLDEFAFVEPHIANGFISSVFPTISSMESAKVVVTSTPNGLNHFHKMWSEAKTLLKAKKLLEPKDWRTLEIPWDAVPGRNEAWKKNEINKIGEVRFKQEYECISYDEIITIIDTFTGEIQKIKIGDLYGML